MTEPSTGKVVETTSLIPTLSVPPVDSQKLQEERLFRHFRGWLFSERAKDTTSWTWDYGYDIQRAHERRWNASKHLFKEHHVRAPEGRTKSWIQLKAESVEKQHRSITDTLTLDPMKPREQAMANSLVKSFDKDHFQRMVIQWIVKSNLPFLTVEDEDLRAIFDYLSPSVSIRGGHLSADTLRTKIIAEYQRHRHTVIDVLRQSPGLIHISFDGWTSGNRHALYGIACFFRDEHNKPCKIVLGVPEVTIRHNGSNIATQVLDIWTAYQITEKIGYFTLDNAENNNTAMGMIGRELGFNGTFRRGRCSGHTVNSSAKALLFGKNLLAFEEQLSGTPALLESDWESWRSKRPVGKLHNLVHDIFRSNKLTYLLRDVQQDAISKSGSLKERSKKPLTVVRDNDTRWLSQLHMIRQVRHSVGLPRICEENKLTDSHWEALRHMEKILTHYENVVRTLEGDGQVRKIGPGFTGSYGNVWDVVLGFEELLSKLEHYKLLAAGFPDAEQSRIGINLAWDKLEKYYSALDKTTIYYAALALHPAYKWAYFEQTWDAHPEWVDKAKEMVCRVWRTEYANSYTQADESDDQRPTKRRKFFSPFEANSRHMPARCDSSDDEAVKGDEYDTWQSSYEASDRRVRDPITYWHERRMKYPRLSRMALDFLTIQPMSAECERLFSAAGRMTVPSRSLLDAEIISICQVSRSWYRAGIVKELDPMLISWREEQQIYDSLGMSDGELVQQATAWLRDEGDEEESE
ncbi:restless-like transposase [Fusarium pseudocircinatum]|uniref:Restless-like transposase n=1 Tax=Fusarium pseudocircinatum TaxID=56676 RepID=A0A8H5NSY2_9HYPO|nr:restless-like transposase [Fusarium pseudocircinatum]